MTHKVGAAALAVILPLTAVAVAVGGGTAHAAGTNQSAITVTVSDKTPAAGKKFNVSGTFTIKKVGAVDHRVKVQAKEAGGWTNLKGAHDDTNSSGAYKLNLILDETGTLKLRVVGIGQGKEQNCHQKFKVTVH